MAMKEKAIQYNILKREADTNRELYKDLLQRMKQAGVSAGATASNIKVIDQAEADDTGEGRILFNIPVPSSEERIRIEAEKGTGKRAN